MASFENQSTSMKFALTVDDSKKTVSVSKIASAITANTFSSVATAFKPLFAATPTAVHKASSDLLVE